MKKIILWLALVLLTFLFVGCAQPEVQEPISKQFRFKKILFVFDQKYSTTVKYQSSEVLEKRINDNIIAQLNEKKLLSNEESMNLLKVNVHYKRQFVGQEIGLFATESLAPALIAYDIHVYKNGKEIRTIVKHDQTYNPGFVGNLKTIVGGNRDDSLENEAADATANTIVNAIQQLR